MKVDITVEVNADLDTDKLKKAVSEALEKSAYEVERTAKELVPYETGDLKRSIETSGADWEWNVEPTIGWDYAGFIEEGTTPHTITGNPLHWNRDGEDHYAYSVNHPGNKAYKYMETALESHIEDIADNVAEAVERIL